jgi:hypothetical protein
MDDDLLAVICVYGIYTHAQLDNRFWDSMSFQLGRKGKEYRKNCIRRVPAANKGDYVCVPGSRCCATRVSAQTDACFSSNFRRIARSNPDGASGRTVSNPS